MTQQKSRAQMFNDAVVKGMEHQIATTTLTTEKKDALKKKILNMRANANK